MTITLTLDRLDQDGARFATWLRLEFHNASVGSGRGVRVETHLSREDWEAAGMPTALQSRLVDVRAVSE